MRTARPLSSLGFRASLGLEPPGVRTGLGGEGAAAMTHDFGVRKTRRNIPFVPLALVVAGLLLAGTRLMYWREVRTVVAAQTRQMTLGGQPCPGLTRQAFVDGHMAASLVFDFGDVRFARRFGHVDCSMVAERGGAGAFYPVCDFTGPAVLVVTTKKGEVYFAPGVGNGATVSVAHDQPRCFMGSKFRKAIGL